MAGLSRGDVMRLVNRYVGVSGGYLGDFSYRTHSEFYTEYCDLDVNPDELSGTTRERFIHILSSADPRTQARIVRGILLRFPVGQGPATRTRQLHDEFSEIARRLESASPVPSPAPKVTSRVVEEAIADAETLIMTRGATSGVDRLHTALHGYLLAQCDEAGISHGADPSLTELYKLLRDQHPKLQPGGPRAEDVKKVLKTLSAILDVLNPLRNQASLAHPNKDLLGPAEAMLVVNVTRTVLHYLDAKLS